MISWEEWLRELGLAFLWEGGWVGNNLKVREVVPSNYFQLYKELMDLIYVAPREKDVGQVDDSLWVAVSRSWLSSHYNVKISQQLDLSSNERA